MSIAWESLLVVCVVSLAVGVLIVALVSLALVGLSARRSAVIGVTDGGPGDGATPGVASATGTAIGAACLLAVTVIVGYGLWIIIS